MDTQSCFKPAWWLPGGHLQTLWPSLKKRKIDIPLTRERLWLPDGDFVDLDWISGNETAPLVLILHGLEGSIESSYAKGMLKALKNAGFCAVFMHFRGCSGEHNKKAQAYHAGETQDLHDVLQTLHQRNPSRQIAVIGFSLGGNVLLKYLGETGSDNLIHCAVAISVPFLLNRFADRIQKRDSSMYQKYLLSGLRKKMLDKAKHTPLPIDLEHLDKIKSFWEFDDLVTAKLYGFSGVRDYYEKSSSFHYLSKIKKKSLILHARNDPFLSPDAIPHQNALPDNVQLEIHQSGGHMGFIAGSLPWRTKYWLEERVPSYIQAAYYPEPRGL